MAYIGRLHPLVIHFPIALVIAAVGAEAVAAITSDDRWHVVAVSNLRAGAAFALVAAAAGWCFARSPGMEPTSLLEAHRWLGTVASGMTLAAAGTTLGRGWRSRTKRPIYRIALCAAAALVGGAAHLGGLLVWGADFLRP
jgi:uncharacterized membrane protein